MIFDFKSGCKNEFKDNNENHGADPEIGFLAKSISMSNGCTTAMPTAWELITPFLIDGSRQETRSLSKKSSKIRKKFQILTIRQKDML